MKLPPLDGPVKAYTNIPFLNSHDARSLRVQCELIEPEVRFRRHEIENTIVFFGSARTPSPESAPHVLEKVEKKLKGDQSELAQAKRRAAEGLRNSVKYYQAAREIAYRLTKWSQSQDEISKRCYVCSGGGPGIMEAANRGAAEAGGKSIGLGISLPFEQHNNDYVTQALSFEFHYFFVRKYWFLYPAKGLLVFPGGFGTMDELFEMLTLIQTLKINKPMPIVLYGSDFWKNLVNFDLLIDHGVISPEDMELFRIMDNVDEVVNHVIDEINKNGNQHD